MKITPIEYASSYLTENFVTENGNPDKKIDIVFLIYLIEYKDKLILIDAGCETMPGFEMVDFLGSVEALKRAGKNPEDITDVIITHAHHDHIECVHYFKNAVIHIQKDEYEAGKHCIPESFKVNVFEDFYVLYDCIKIVKIGRHSKGSCVIEIKIDDKNYVFVGDESYNRGYFEKDTALELYKKYGRGDYTVFFSHDY